MRAPFYFITARDHQNLMMPQFVHTSKLLVMAGFCLLLTTVVLPTTSIVAYAQKAQTSSENTNGHVKITSPTKGQQVPASSALLVRGTSTANETAFPSCRVSIIVNGIKPYQNATATGTGGTNDFSTWSYNIPTTYTTLKEGQNKITAKLSCIDNPRTATHNSVNVTGIANNQTSSITPIASNKPKTLSISLNLTNPVSSGSNQTVETTVRDGSNATVAGARVNGTVINSANTAIANFTGITNQSGIFSHSWKIDKDYKPGLFSVGLYASAGGFQHQATPTTAVFNVSDISNHKSSSDSSGSSNHKSHSSHSNSSNNSHDSGSGSSDNSHDSGSGSSDNSHDSGSGSSGNNGHTLSIIHLPHIHLPHIQAPKLPFS